MIAHFPKSGVIQFCLYETIGKLERITVVFYSDFIHPGYIQRKCCLPEASVHIGTGIRKRSVEIDTNHRPRADLTAAFRSNASCHRLICPIQCVDDMFRIFPPHTVAGPEPESIFVDVPFAICPIARNDIGCLSVRIRILHPDTVCNGNRDTRSLCFSAPAARFRKQLRCRSPFMRQQITLYSTAGTAGFRL